MVNDCNLVQKNSAHCKKTHFDQLFILVNASGKAEEREQAANKGAARSKNDAGSMRALNKQESRRTQRSPSGRPTVDEWLRMPQESFHAIVRIAIMRYVVTCAVPDVSQALERLLTQDIFPRLDDIALQDSNDFRRRCCYIEEVCSESTHAGASSSLRDP